MTDKASGPDLTVSQERFDSWGPGARSVYLRYLFVKDRYGSALHAKSTNLIRKYTREYDAALSSLDALVMPTIPFPATRSFAEGSTAGPMERMMRNLGVMANTAAFNSTGHPALSVPVGFVPSAEGAEVKLPAALQIVGKHFDDLTCYKIGAAWEGAEKWETLAYGV